MGETARGGALSGRVALPALPQSVRRARAFVRTTLVDTDPDLVDTVQLAVSEVVTNALVHAGTAISVKLSVGPTAVRVAVTDGSPRMPRSRAYADLAGTGRGLRLLNELTTRWGTDLRHDGEDGKTVWFEISLTGAPNDRRYESSGAGHPADGPTGETASGSGTRASVVLLLGAPVLLYAAWRQHADALLRESFLARLDSGADAEAVRVHSEASDALAVLDEAMPAPPATDTPAAALAAATAPEATAERVRMLVSGDVRPHFATLDRAMDDAIEMADSDRLLTPPVQPELRLMRRWMCAEVASQCDGGTPREWQSFADARTTALSAPSASGGSAMGPTPAAAAWARAHVTDSEAIVVADRNATLIALSGPAARLLGYDDATELVGQRLVSLIPERYRQAHLAGLTIHLLNGRGALLDSPVTVPVLRRDDTEALVTLTLRERHTADGEPVFLGELGPG